MEMNDPSPFYGTHIPVTPSHTVFPYPARTGTRALGHGWAGVSSLPTTHPVIASSTVTATYTICRAHSRGPREARLWPAAFE
ncbi:hypothetical protein AB0N81_40810 [Streptomyces sp. NPDC093510]|uniref:hypothetical protein n=1 Tax=unclassified Streptomyces TaxID=2593676 RepID=UPI000F74B0F2|nr:hypothetical protein [Streptomyces sp. WAC 01529]